MFDGVKRGVGQLQFLQRLLSDPHVRALVAHPKVQLLMRDPAVQAAVRTQDAPQLMACLGPLREDPELSSLFAKIDPRLFQPSS